MEYNNDQEVREAAETLLRSNELHYNQNVHTPNLDLCKCYSQLYFFFSFNLILY